MNVTGYNAGEQSQSQSPLRQTFIVRRQDQISRTPDSEINLNMKSLA